MQPFPPLGPRVSDVDSAAVPVLFGGLLQSRTRSILLRSASIFNCNGRTSVDNSHREGHFNGLPQCRLGYSRIDAWFHEPAEVGLGKLDRRFALPTIFRIVAGLCIRFLARTILPQRPGALSTPSLKNPRCFAVTICHSTTAPTSTARNGASSRRWPRICGRSSCQVVQASRITHRP